MVHLDFETFSEANLFSVGAYSYAQHPSTEVLIAAYWLPDMDPTVDEPLVWLPRDQPVPKNLLRAVRDEGLEFGAHNAQFERSIWSFALRRMHPNLPDIPTYRWACTAMQAAANGLPRSLDGALEMLGTKVRKDPAGAALIKKFCKPRKPTKANPRKRILPEDEPAEFKRFIKYCQRDVLGEMELVDKLPPLLPREREFYALDMVMNERGLPIDIPLVQKTQAILKQLEANIAHEVAELTGGLRATQRDKMLDVFSKLGVDLENMQAQTIRDLIKERDDLSPKAKRLLELRIESSKASTKKLVSMLACAHPVKHIVQGSFLINGAHTGRYAARLIQPQNFIRGTLKQHQQDLVFELLEMGSHELFDILYEWPIDIISQCMRGFIKAPKGYRFVVVDYTAIEARVLAWVADEFGVLESYRQGLDVYKVLASTLFNVTYEKVSDEQRRIAKNLVLGCGYGLGGVKFVDYCAKAGVIVTEEFAKKAVALYRKQHPRIVKVWKEVEDAAAKAIRNSGSTFEAAHCEFYMQDHWLCVKLPSGREIKYPYVRATPVERWGKPAFQISFKTQIKGHVYRETTYGGKLVENIVQAIARDIMREGMFSSEEAGYPVCGTVHDEILTLRKIGEGSSAELAKLVCKPRRWMRGIPLNSAGFETIRYKKG